MVDPLPARTPDQERVRAYLLALSERESWLELWPRVLGARVELIDLLHRLTPEQATYRPAPEEWSILDAATHAAEVAWGVLATVERLGGATAPTPAPLPAAGPHTAERLRLDLVRNAIALSTVPQRLPERPPLEPTAPHMFFGELHCKAWFLFQRVHDQDHVGQIRTIQSAPGYPAPASGA